MNLNLHFSLWKYEHPNFDVFQHILYRQKCQDSMRPILDLEKRKKNVFKFKTKEFWDPIFFKSQRFFDTFGVAINTIFIVFILDHTFQKLLKTILYHFFPFHVWFWFTRSHIFPLCWKNPLVFTMEIFPDSLNESVKHLLLQKLTDVDQNRIEIDSSWHRRGLENSFQGQKM